MGLNDRLVNVHLPGDRYPLYGYAVVPADEVGAIRELAESKDLRCDDHPVVDGDRLRSFLEALDGS